MLQTFVYYVGYKIDVKSTTFLDNIIGYHCHHIKDLQGGLNVFIYLFEYLTSKLTHGLGCMILEP